MPPTTLPLPQLPSPCVSSRPAQGSPTSVPSRTTVTTCDQPSIFSSLRDLIGLLSALLQGYYRAITRLLQVYYRFFIKSPPS